MRIHLVLPLLVVLMGPTNTHAGDATLVSLPVPAHRGMTIEQTLAARQTVREFSSRPLELTMLSQLLWAAQGITHGDGYRTAPSAGALYPLELDVVVGQVEGLPPAIYRYLPADHRLRLQQEGDRRREVAVAALEQMWLEEAAVLVIIRAIEARTSRKYGERAALYVPLEAGAALQNLLLQAVSLGLAGATVGAFRPQRLGALLGGSEDEVALVIVPIGYAAP